MNLAEFKAWFEGYTENLRDVPSAKQWARIKARVEEITPQATEVRYFYDRYWRPDYGLGTRYTNTSVSGSIPMLANAQCNNGLGSMGNATQFTMTSTDAFTMLGKADALSEAA